jgi:hypothetical protein
VIASISAAHIKPASFKKGRVVMAHARRQNSMPTHPSKCSLRKPRLTATLPVKMT